MKAVKANKIRGWRASDKRRLPLLINTHTSILKSITQNNVQLEQKNFMQVLSGLHLIPIKRTYLKNNFKAAVLKINKRSEISLKKMIYSRFSIFHHSHADSILVLNNTSCPFSLMQQLSKEKYPFIIFGNIPKKFLHGIKRLPANWQNGLIKHEQAKLKPGQGEEEILAFIKLYITSWKSTVELITNIENISVDTIKNISAALPIPFLS